MNYRTLDGIVVLEGLEAIRRRPSMFIGEEGADRSRRALLLKGLIHAITNDAPPSKEIRVLLWHESDITIAFDGAPLPIEPSGAAFEVVSHPALYRLFMEMRCGSGPFGLTDFAPVLNALSERLVVSTMHEGHRYRVVFSKGMVACLLGREHCNRPLGTTWLTFRADPAIVTGEPLTLGGVRRIAGQISQNAGGVRIRVEDRTSEDADWY